MKQASLSPSPKLRFFGTNGRPLSGGFLITYDYVTSLPVATWNDAEMTTRNPAQLTLDSNGEPSNNGVPVCVFLEDGRRYKYRWFDSEGTPVGSAGPIQTATITYGSDTTFNYYANVEGTIDEIVVDVSTDQATGVRTYFVKLATAVKNTIATLVENVSALFTNLSNEVTRATNAESALNTAIGNEVTRATNADSALSNAITAEENRAKAAEAAAKTVVKAGANIEVTKTTAQDGHDEYTVNGVESVPHVEIVSPNDTLNISSTENHQTNTKTFNIDVKGSLEYYIGGTNAWKTLTTSRDIVQDLTKSKGALNLSAPGIGKYLVSVNLRFKSNSAPENIVGELWVSLGPEDAFTQMKLVDYSQNSVEDCMTVVAIKAISLASEPLMISLRLNNAPTGGIKFVATNVSVYRISSVLGAVTGMEVEHDESLTGDGTSESLLGVVIDENLDPESKNPVENRAVDTALNGKQDQLTEMLDQEISDLIETLN